MKRPVLAGFLIYMIVAGLGCRQHPSGVVKNRLENEDLEKEEKLAQFVKDRALYEYRMLKDPVTGKIPLGIREKEMAEARLLPFKQNGLGSGIQGTENLNTYTPAGPNNIGGRTRAVAYDRRFNGTTNRVIIAGSISGGIFRTADGGATWARVNPENDIHNLSSLAQDPNNPDTWYAGGGEPIANSASDAGALYLGFGIWKSTNNGQTWVKLPLQVTDIDGTTVLGGGVLETFDNVFDFVHKIVVNPLNSDVYVCGHRRLVRSTNGGSSWNVVFTTTTPTTASQGQMDVVATSTGKLYLAVNGGLPDTLKRGIWVSASGNANTWARISGGNSLGADSVAGWRGNEYTVANNSRRIVMALAPSNQNILYVTYENGQDGSGTNAKPEADLFKYDAGSNTWTNLSANVPDFPGQLDGVDPFNVQFGYNLTVAVKPDDPNTIFLGGVNFFRSTNGFTNTSATTWIGGYGKDLTSLNIYGSKTNPNDNTKWSHPDFHAIAFNPANPSIVIAGNDGGIQVTNDIMGSAAGDEPVLWSMFANYQTLQYYHVAMDPGSGRNNFIGGSQDNGTRFRDINSPLGTGAGDFQIRILGGDGGASGIAKTGATSQNIFCSTQYGNILRVTLTNLNIGGGTIRPTGLTATPGLSDAYGDFVTYFKLDFDNTEDLYYVNFNRLFRTTAASTVSSSTWTELTGVRSAVNPANPANGTDIGITTMDMSRGDYFPSHALYMGTSNGRVFRLDNPRNALATASPVDITPPQIRNRGYISDIAVNPNDDAEIMVVAANYTYTETGTTFNTINIWWTNNAKSSTPTWYNAEGTLTLPSIRSCAIVVKKDASNNPVTEYYVGTSVGLYSAVNIAPIVQANGSVNWVREGGNVLNYSVVTSLDYRPQDNVLLVGTHGNGMYYASTGTPNFLPNQNTAVNEPNRNDKNFIKLAFPTVVDGNINYRIGNMFTIRNMAIQVFSMNGQQVYRKQTGYQDGTIDVKTLPKGAYILTITSDDYKQQFIQKFVKN